MKTHKNIIDKADVIMLEISVNFFVMPMLRSINIKVYS